MNEKKPKKKRPRDAEATKARILAAAYKEFTKLGLHGARIAAIAARSDANKQMIYAYYGSKEGLFQAVIEEAWRDIRTAEQLLHLEDLEPMEAMRKLTRFTWDYYVDNPSFVALVNSENLHRAVYLKKAKGRLGEMQAHMVDMIADILKKGVAKGVFRSGIDPTQLAITIAGISYYYLSNSYTGSVLYGFDFASPEAREERKKFNVETIEQLLRP
jgi:AcrR family transcriptional regulator